MKEIELVIKINEEIYLEAIKSGYSHLYDEEVANAVANGIPLPEHHGDLKDVSKLVYDCSYDNGNGCDRICHCDSCNYHVLRESAIKTLSAIIPATKEKSCEDCTNWNEHYGTITCVDCQNHSLWKSNQSTTKEGAE